MMTPGELNAACRRKAEDRVNVERWEVGGSLLDLIIWCNLRLTAALRAQMKRGRPGRMDLRFRGTPPHFVSNTCSFRGLDI